MEEDVTVRYNNEIFTLRVPAGTSDEDIQSFLESQSAQPTEQPTQQPTQTQESLVSQIPVEPGYVPSQPQQAQEPSFTDRLLGAGETALTLGTGAVGGTLGTLYGAGEGIAQSIGEGTFGTQEGVRTAEQAAMSRAGQLTYSPRTEAGKEMTQATGEFLASALPPVLPILGAPGQITATAKPSVAFTARVVAKAMDKADEPQNIAARGSVGAATTPQALQRTTIAESMPVPFTGKTGLTAGQATRSFDQLQFEKEVAKLDVGAPLRERILNQTEAFNQNFDAFIDNDNLAAPLVVRDAGVATARGVPAKELLGESVSSALMNKREAIKTRIKSLYAEADKKGQTSAPVDMVGLSSLLNEIVNFEGRVTNIPAIKNEAVRLGILKKDKSGIVTPSSSTVTIKDAETLRQFVNKATNWTDSSEATFAKQITGKIDDATEASGGDLYKKARKLRTEYANEFQNTSLVRSLLGTKRGTSERQVAFEKVFDKVILSSSKEEMNKLRKTLLTSGDEGKQAWVDLKSAGIEFLKESSLSSTRDARGNYTLLPSKLSANIRKLDQSGKLESLYGRKRAQQIRDLATLASDIYTAPAGAINTSNTAAALNMMLDVGAGYAVSGIPAPVVTALKTANRYVKDYKVKKRIEEALKPVGQVVP